MSITSIGIAVPRRRCFFLVGMSFFGDDEGEEDDEDDEDDEDEDGPPCLHPFLFRAMLPLPFFGIL